jgi:hypothetical protein
MKIALLSLAASLALTASSSLASAGIAWRFPPKGGVPYAVQVPDAETATARRGKSKLGYGRTKPTEHRRLVRPFR